MTSITLIEWQTTTCAIVHVGNKPLNDFIKRIVKVAPVVVKATFPLRNKVPYGALRDGWESNAAKHGAIWATGFSAAL